jgi:hypothetical protein
MFGKKNEGDKAEDTAPTTGYNPPEYIKNLEAWIRVIARQEAEKLLREILATTNKPDTSNQ